MVFQLMIPFDTDICQALSIRKSFNSGITGDLSFAFANANP